MHEYDRINRLLIKNDFSERTGCSLGENDTGRVVDDQKNYTFPNDGHVIIMKVRDAVPVLLILGFIILYLYLCSNFSQTSFRKTH